MYNAGLVIGTVQDEWVHMTHAEQRPLLHSPQNQGVAYQMVTNIGSMPSFWGQWQNLGHYIYLESLPVNILRPVQLNIVPPRGLKYQWVTHWLVLNERKISHSFPYQYNHVFQLCLHLICLLLWIPYHTLHCYWLIKKPPCTWSMWNTAPIFVLI